MALHTPAVPTHDEDRVSVTTARLSHSDDLALRQRRYMITQAVRVSCVILGVALPVAVPLKLLLFVGAVCLPWFGVVMANAGPTVQRKERTAIVDRQAPQLPEQPYRLAIEPGRVVDAQD